MCKIHNQGTMPNGGRIMCPLKLSRIHLLLLAKLPIHLNYCIVTDIFVHISNKMKSFLLMELLCIIFVSHNVSGQGTFMTSFYFLS